MEPKNVVAAQQNLPDNLASRNFLPPTSRLWHLEPALGCVGCFMKTECGGWHDDGLDCFEANCCGKTKTCQYACVRSDNFLKVYRDTGGFSSFQKWELRQEVADWPEYIPVIQNKSSRRALIHRPIIAVPTSKLLRWGNNGEKAYYSKQNFYDVFKLDSRTEVLAVSVEKDPALESFWKYRLVRDYARRLRMLGIQRAICPDFSTAVNVPRLDNLANRRRSLICAEEFSAAGISVVPFLLATHEFDWLFWLSFLKEHSEINTVAKEFQTGASRKTIGEWHAQWLLRLEQELGRGLHLIAVGGRRLIPLLSKMRGLTILDSTPFMKAMKRRRLMIKNHQWSLCRTPRGEPIDELLAHNTCIYEQYVLQRIKTAREKGGRPSRAPQNDQREPTSLMVTAQPGRPQLSLPFESTRSHLINTSAAG